jgi:hypothetical protein
MPTSPRTPRNKGRNCDACASPDSSEAKSSPAARPLTASPSRTCAQAVAAAECVKQREQGALKLHVARNKKEHRSSKSSVCSELGRCGAAPAITPQCWAHSFLHGCRPYVGKEIFAIQQQTRSWPWSQQCICQQASPIFKAERLSCAGLPQARYSLKLSESADTSIPHACFITPSRLSLNTSTQICTTSIRYRSRPRFMSSLRACKQRVLLAVGLALFCRTMQLSLACRRSSKVSRTAGVMITVGSCSSRF